MAKKKAKQQPKSPAKKPAEKSAKKKATKSAGQEPTPKPKIKGRIVVKKNVSTTAPTKSDNNSRRAEQVETAPAYGLPRESGEQQVSQHPSRYASRRDSRNDSAQEKSSRAVFILYFTKSPPADNPTGPSEWWVLSITKERFINHHGNNYSLPGGMVMKNENLVEAAQRISMRETGLQLLKVDDLKDPTLVEPLAGANERLQRNTRGSHSKFVFVVRDWTGGVPEGGEVAGLPGTGWRLEWPGYDHHPKDNPYMLCRWVRIREFYDNCFKEQNGAALEKAMIAQALMGNLDFGNLCNQLEIVA